MYYCLECTNKILMLEPVGKEDVETQKFFCRNCGLTLPCVIRFKNYNALAKLNYKAYKRFEKSCWFELMERWDEVEFQEEKEVFLTVIKRKRKEKEEREKYYYVLK